MKRANLQLVVNNVAAHNDEFTAPPFDFKAFAIRTSRLFALVWLVLRLPFRLIAGIGRLLVATGLGFFHTLFRAVMALIGLALICTVLFGVGRVLLFPLFH